jgi:phage I-like protein
VAVKALIAKAETKPEAVSLSEHQETVNKVATLETKLAEKEKVIALSERDGRVNKAMAAGKVLPAQKSWADEYALKDPAGFDAFVTAAPVAVELKEKGSSAETPADVQLTEAEVAMGAKMGVSKEELIKAKKQE